MTKREQFQSAFDLLFDDIDLDDVLELIGNHSERFCWRCKYSDECDRAFFETDKDGNFIFDDDGDRIPRDCPEMCEDILRKVLDEEV